MTKTVASHTFLQLQLAYNCNIQEKMMDAQFILNNITACLDIILIRPTFVHISTKRKRNSHHLSSMTMFLTFTIMLMCLQ